MSKKKNNGINMLICYYVFKNTMSEKKGIMYMIRFNFNRFVKLARWTLTIDRKYHVKSFFQNLVILTLVFVFFT